jgi:hypothetical protein
MLSDPQAGMQLYFQGKLKVTGDPMLATKLQSQCNDLKREVENAAGIIPGDRGKAADSWCWQPLCT